MFNVLQNSFEFVLLMLVIRYIGYRNESYLGFLEFDLYGFSKLVIIIN